ncbi:MAG: HlyD family efflux transporter periplasmic adaptor subunit [Alphaproteobacteria bacterium]|nr:MAG: HlyD family efflux transporter periplasmic adaptor subunit [Alphaproteobacteria bacterium]
MRFRTVLFGVLVAAGIGAAGYEMTRPELVPVDLAEIVRGPIEVTINGDGMTRIRDVYEVFAPVTGMVQRSPVEVGDAVTAGETVVARIAPGEPAFLDERARAQAEAAVAQAEAALSLAEANTRAAEADLANAQRQFDRIYALHERGSASDAQLDEAEVALDLAAAKFDSARATERMRKSELDAAKAVLIAPDPGKQGTDAAGECCMSLRAPITGKVLAVDNMSARMVSAGARLLTIGPPNDLEITVDLLSTDAVRLAPGAPAHVERWGGEGQLEARVREIEPAAFTKVSALGIEEQRVRVLLDFVTPPEARPSLGHNFRVYLRIVEWQGSDEVLVPIGALFREGSDWAVFVVEDGRAVRHKVEIGRRNTEVAQVLGGLTPGDRVITHPSERVSDGTLVVDRESID